jgi:hypothetical protein
LRLGHEDNVITAKILSIQIFTAGNGGEMDAARRFAAYRIKLSCKRLAPRSDFKFVFKELVSFSEWFGSRNYDPRQPVNGQNRRTAHW